MDSPCFHRIKAIRVSALSILFRVFILITIGLKLPAHSTSQPADLVLRQALEHADWFNWADAAPEFQEAQRLFIIEHDRRNALYARIGTLRATMEDHSLTEVQKELAELVGRREVL
jgi:hypothetical protein